MGETAFSPRLIDGRAEEDERERKQNNAKTKQNDHIWQNITQASTVKNHIAHGASRIRQRNRLTNRSKPTRKRFNWVQNSSNKCSHTPHNRRDRIAPLDHHHTTGGNDADTRKTDDADQQDRKDEEGIHIWIQPQTKNDSENKIGKDSERRKCIAPKGGADDHERNWRG